MITEGIPAPDFSLPDQNGVIHRLSQYKGSWVVIYFYPKDDTPGCTKEACGFRDSYDQFQDKNIIILGISKDTVSSHDRFVRKYSLPFPILSDPDAIGIGLYGAWGKKKFMGREFEGVLRNTVLIRPDGTVGKIFRSVTPATHAQEILQEMITMK